MSEGHPHEVPWSDIVEVLRPAYGDETAIVLIGSAARGVWTPRSDIDLLVIAKKRPTPKALPKYHVQVYSEDQFLRNLKSGEDFEPWCVRFGQPLYDCGIWGSISSTEEANIWPRWRTKVVHGVRRLFLAASLLRGGDTDAAAEESLYVLGHIARGLLLRAMIFPLSRPELAEQVKTLGYAHLAALHERIRLDDHLPQRQIEVAQRYGKKLLLAMDRTIYAQAVNEHRRIKTAKKARQLSQ